MLRLYTSTHRLAQVWKPIAIISSRVPAYLKYGKRQGTLKSNSEWRTARHRSPRNSPLTAPFAEPSPIYFFQCSLFKVRYSMFAEPFPFAAPFTVAFQCRLTLSILKRTRKRGQAKTKRRENDKMNCFSRFRAHIIQHKVTQIRGNADTNYWIRDILKPLFSFPRSRVPLFRFLVLIGDTRKCIIVTVTKLKKDKKATFIDVCPLNHSSANRSI